MGQLVTSANEIRLSYLVNSFLNRVRDGELVNGDRTCLADAMDAVKCLVLMEVESGIRSDQINQILLQGQGSSMGLQELHGYTQ